MQSRNEQQCPLSDMRSPRSGRNIRRALAAFTAVLLLLGIVATREPPEVRRSRAVRLGMTRSEVETVMGKPDGTWGVAYPEPGAIGGGGGGIPNGIYFGRSIGQRLRVLKWIGISRSARHDEWTVCVRFDRGGEVDLIQRAEEPAESAP